MTTIDRLKFWAMVIPDMPRVEVTRRAGVSRARIHQLCTKHNLPFPKQGTRKVLCAVCGLPILGANLHLFRRVVAHKRCRKKILYVELPCRGCGRLVLRSKALLVWRRAHTPFPYKRVYCSRKCRMEPLTWPCAACGEDFSLSMNQSSGLRRAHQKNVYCSKPECRKALGLKKWKVMLEARRKKKTRQHGERRRR